MFLGMNDADHDRSWTLSAPTLSPAELETALIRALGPELAAAKDAIANDRAKQYPALPHLKLSTARSHIYKIAIDLAEHGMPEDVIRAAMIDMAVGASRKASAFLREHEEGVLEEQQYWERMALRDAQVDADADDAATARSEEMAGRKGAVREVAQ